MTAAAFDSPSDSRTVTTLRTQISPTFMTALLDFARAWLQVNAHNGVGSSRYFQPVLHYACGSLRINPDAHSGTSALPCGHQGRSVSASIKNTSRLQAKQRAQ